MERLSPDQRFPSKEVSAAANAHLRTTYGLLGQFLGNATRTESGKWEFAVHGRTQEIEDAGVIGTIVVDEATGEVTSDALETFSQRRLEAVQSAERSTKAFIAHLLKR